MVGLSTLGVVLLQVLAAISIVAFFRRRGERDYWRTLIFPGVGAIALGAAFVLAVVYFPTLVGTNNPLIDGVPCLLLVAVFGGLITGLWLRRHRPAVYAKIAQSQLRARPRTLATPDDMDSPLLRHRRRSGRAGRGPGAAGRGHPVRLVRAVRRRRRHLERGRAGQPDLRLGALHLVEVPVRIRRPPDAGRLSGLPVVAPGPRLHPWLRRRARICGRWSRSTPPSTPRCRSDDGWDGHAVDRRDAPLRRPDRRARRHLAPEPARLSGPGQFRGEIRHSSTYVGSGRIPGQARPDRRRRQLRRRHRL